MPVYEYEHINSYCAAGKTFEITQSISSKKLTECPFCERPVKKIVSLAAINTPKTNSDLKNMGFTKLVKRDKGIYENVTATGNESKIWDSSKPETMPDLSKKIRD
jgi:putative FmdB family regulatory protein